MGEKGPQIQSQEAFSWLLHVPDLTNWSSVRFSAGLVISKNKQMAISALWAGEQSTRPWLCLYEVCYLLSKKISISSNYCTVQDSQAVV